MDMRVANVYNTYSIQNTKSTGGVKKADRTSKVEEQKDNFSLSLQAEDYQAVRKALAGVPDIRGDKVNQLKARIDANQYNVSGRDVAAKMLNNLG